MFCDVETLLEERDIYVSDYVRSSWDQKGWVFNAVFSPLYYTCHKILHPLIKGYPCIERG